MLYHWPATQILQRCQTGSPTCACPETVSRAACRPRSAFPTCRLSLGHNTLGWHAASAKANALHACQPCYTLMWCAEAACWQPGPVQGWR